MEYKTIITNNNKLYKFETIDNLQEFYKQHKNGEKLTCIEQVSNDENETSIAIVIVNNATLKECEEIAKAKTTSNEKWIAIEYTIQNESLVAL